MNSMPSTDSRFKVVSVQVFFSQTETLLRAGGQRELYLVRVVPRYVIRYGTPAVCKSAEVLYSSYASFMTLPGTLRSEKLVTHYSRLFCGDVEVCLGRNILKVRDFLMTTLSRKSVPCVCVCLSEFSTT